MPRRTPVPATARAIALGALRRIEHDGAYANLVVPAILAGTRLDARDRALVTGLVYGTTRMRRACDVAIERFVLREPEPDIHSLLRLGTYQLLFTAIAAHAAVSETVALAPRATRGFVNAVLRRIASTPMRWPDDATRLSYPDWIVERLVAELGPDASPALERMNRPAPVTVRDDGYVQDRASQWVVDAVDVVVGSRVLDVCAGPGGKATALAARGASVIAFDVHPHRAGLVARNASRLGLDVPVAVADATRPPLPEGSVAAVLLDAPCTGLGALRRRPDARWRITDADIDALAALQRELLGATARLVGPAGSLVYSVCTLTAAESIDHPVPAGFAVDERPLPAPWRRYGHGHRLLPQDADTDGMVVLRYRRRDG